MNVVSSRVETPQRKSLTHPFFSLPEEVLQSAPDQIMRLLNFSDTGIESKIQSFQVKIDYAKAIIQNQLSKSEYEALNSYILPSQSLPSTLIWIWKRQQNELKIQAFLELKKQKDFVGARQIAYEEIAWLMTAYDFNDEMVSLKKTYPEAFEHFEMDVFHDLRFVIEQLIKDWKQKLEGLNICV